MAITRWTWVSQFPSMLVSSTYSRTLTDKWHRSFMGQMSFLSPNQQCQSTEGNSKHWPDLPPFFNHRWSPDARAPIPLHWLSDASINNVHTQSNEVLSAGHQKEYKSTLTFYLSICWPPISSMPPWARIGPPKNSQNLPSKLFLNNAQQALELQILL